MSRYSKHKAPVATTPLEPPIESAERAAVTAEVCAPPDPIQPQEATTEASPEQPNGQPQVQTRVVSMAEPGAASASAEHWYQRKLRAEVMREELRNKFHRRGYILAGKDLYDKAVQLFIHALIGEERLTHDEAAARLVEYQLIYMQAEYNNLEHERAEKKRSGLSTYLADLQHEQRVGKGA